MHYSKLIEQYRDHFKHDLRPYICTYDDCAEPTVLYDSWEDWVRHEQWAHRQRIWRCPDHPQHEFSKRSEYEDHVTAQHADSKNSLLSSELLAAQESVSCALDRPCPFCLQDSEDVFEMQRHIAGHLEAVALLSIPNLDDDNKSAKGNSNSANSNHAESKAGDFDYTEALIFPENEGPAHLRPSSGAEKRAFRTKLGIMTQSFNEASSESVTANTRQYEDLVGDWLDGVRAGTRISPMLDHTNDVIDTYKQLAQALRVISIEDVPNEQLLRLSQAVLSSLPAYYRDPRSPNPSNRDLNMLYRLLDYNYDIIEGRLGSLSQALSRIFVDSKENRSARKTRLKSYQNSYEEATNTILGLLDNIIRLLENTEGYLNVSNLSSAP